MVKNKTVTKRIKAIKTKMSFKIVPLKSVSEIKNRLNATKINRTAKNLFIIFPLDVRRLLSIAFYE